MKAQYLKKLLDINYTVADFGKYIGIGSDLCHDLIKMDKETMKISYALDTWNEGKECLKDKSDSTLLNIWNKLEELIESGEIKKILEGNDIFENPIPVYYERDGEIIETYCYEMGWPNTTIEGMLMYENTFFKDPIKAVERALKDAKIGIEWINESIEQKIEELKKKNQRLSKEISREKRLIIYLKNKE